MLPTTQQLSGPRREKLREEIKGDGELWRRIEYNIAGNDCGVILPCDKGGDELHLWECVCGIQ